MELHRLRAMPSYSPEAIALTKRPVFNTRADSVFEDGDVDPGLEAVDTTQTVTLLDQGPAPNLEIATAGSGLTNGTPTDVATTTLTGVGSGLTVDITVAGGTVTVAAVNSPGNGYSLGDTVGVVGYTGVVLEVTEEG